MWDIALLGPTLRKSLVLSLTQGDGLLDLQAAWYAATANGIYPKSNTFQPAQVPTSAPQKEIPGTSEGMFEGKHWVSSALLEGRIAVDATKTSPPHLSSRQTDNYSTLQGPSRCLPMNFLPGSPVQRATLLLLAKTLLVCTGSNNPYTKNSVL